MPAAAAAKLPAGAGGVAVLQAPQLQRELEALWSLAPKLCPVVRPKGMDDMALRALAEREPEPLQATKELKQAVEEAAVGCRRCGLCGQPGEASTQTAPAGEADDPATLRFSTTWRPDFTSKTLWLTSAQFACGYCRALQETSAFMQFAAAGDRTSQPEEAAQLMQTLCSHLVEVNQPEGIDASNPVAAAAWAQEVFATAYALHVVASNIRGWKMTGSSGDELKYRTVQGTAAAQAAEFLAAKPRKGKRKSQAADSGEAKGPATPAPKTKTKKAKKSRLAPLSKTPMPGKSGKALTTESSGGGRKGRRLSV